MVNVHPSPANLFQYLDENPRGLDILVKLFSSSQFLTEILLRSPGLLEKLAATRRLATPKSAELCFSEALAAAHNCNTYLEQLDALRLYQRGEFLRIGVCDLLDLYDLPAVTRQLSNLADGMIHCCLDLVAGTLPEPAPDFTVIAMGKLGGRELNYSSDIDLLFLSSPNSPGAARTGEKTDRRPGAGDPGGLSLPGGYAPAPVGLDRPADLDPGWLPVLPGQTRPVVGKTGPCSKPAASPATRPSCALSPARPARCCSNAPPSSSAARCSR